ncbi:hypothetical protein RMATCC62417_07382 [Rhizopus microsporus]|nr:hypothetical protein RMATCC62417_07382 [Rhizopus microsporus]CEI89825.1 hypothetical protein RMCBS344292_04170 [Rhizopus microsporus]
MLVFIIVYFTLLVQVVIANTEKIILQFNHDLPVIECLEITALLSPPFDSLRDSISSQQSKYYALANLKNGSTYEIRVSYPAITPADFYIKTLGTCQGDLYLEISAKSTGVSRITQAESEVITFDLVIENLYFGVLFYNVYKLVITISITLFISYFILMPRVKRFITLKAL